MSEEKTPITQSDIRAAKGKRRLSMVTAYDYSMASFVDEGGADMVLVGDSLGMVMLGYEDTVGVTLDDMIHHTKAVVRGVARALVVADLPFMTYEPGVETALRCAASLSQKSGVRAIKLEGGREMVPQVQALVRAGLGVAGHIGLTPQRAATLGGFKVQGKTAADALRILDDAVALEQAGCFCIVLEAVPASVAEEITKRLSIPTIGIGAGVCCDGQVLVIHDLLGLTKGHTPRFSKQYVQWASEGAEAVREYSQEVREARFPASEHSFSMPKDELDLFLQELNKRSD